MKRLVLAASLVLALMLAMMPSGARADSSTANASHPFAVGGGETTLTEGGVTFKANLAFAAQQTGRRPHHQRDEDK